MNLSSRLAACASPLALAAVLVACTPPTSTDAGTLVDGGAPPSDGGAPPTDGGAPPTDGGTVPVDGGSSSSDGGTSSDGGVGPLPDAGACVVDGGCDGTCQQLPDDPDARAYCVVDIAPFTTGCFDDAGPNGACCVNDDCTLDGGTGVCTAFTYRYCGGAAPPDENVCRFDECDDDGDCGANKACLPRGAFGNVTRQCADAECRSDFDCTARAGGLCLTLNTGACGSVGGFYCTYDDDVCRTDGDCQGSFDVCEPGTGGTACVSHPPAP